MSAAEWTDEFGPFGSDDKPLPYDQIPATLAVRDNRPYHGNFRIRAAGGGHQDIAASAIPIVGLGGSTGAIVIFWPQSVTYWIEKGTGVDPSKVNIEIQMPDMPPPLDLK